MNQPTLAPLQTRNFTLPADGKHQLVPIGEHPIRDSASGQRIRQVVDAAAVAAMAANIRTRQNEANWPNIVVDREHFSLDPEKESRAAGWLTDAEPRSDGLWGSIRWSNSGREEVEGGEYRFLSPVFDRNSAVPLGGNRFRVMKLIGLAVTNQPNIKTVLPLANSAAVAARTRAIDEGMVPEVVRHIDCLAARACGEGAFQNRWISLVRAEPSMEESDALLHVLQEDDRFYRAYRNALGEREDREFRSRRAARPEAEFARALVGSLARADNVPAPLLNRLRDMLHVDPGLDEAGALVAMFTRHPALYDAYLAALG